ncbi:MAG: hypothetical protein JRG89_13035 [Deltaproteobacteria bacterium]|nr:hypothetical protein [Deltaproteobacteria bacterium]
MQTLRKAALYAALHLACMLVVCDPATAAEVECEHVAINIQATAPMTGDDQNGSGTGGTGVYAQQGSGTGGTGLSEPNGSGTGGTGLGEPNGSGTGGTGIYAQQGSGTGGTGLEPSETAGGIGGTGIFGTVMAFGSVCVNGLKVEYDAETPVETNGLKGRAEDLVLGQIVRIETGRADPNRAQRITIESPLSGPVNRVEPEQERLFIMGAEIRLRPGAVIRGSDSRELALTDLQRGDHVEVSGLRRGDGVLMASRLDVRPAGTPTLVTGVAVPVSRSTFYVGRVRGQLASDDTVEPEMRRGRVQIRGNWNMRTQTLENVTLRLAPVHLADMNEVSIQGYVARDRGLGDFKIADTRLSVSVALAGSAEAQSFDPDALVRVRGRIDEDGRLQASRIVIEERGGAEASSGVAPNAAIAKDQAAGPSESTFERVTEKIEDQFDRLSPEDREEIEERLEAARAEVITRAARFERAEIEKRIERIDRGDIRNRVERIEREERQERVEKIERVERDERVERVEKEARHEIEERIERSD